LIFQIPREGIRVLSMKNGLHHHKKPEVYEF